MKEFSEFSSISVEASQKRLRAERGQLVERRAAPRKGFYVCPAFNNLRATCEPTLPVAPTTAIFIRILTERFSLVTSAESTGLEIYHRLVGYIPSRIDIRR